MQRWATCPNLVSNNQQDILANRRKMCGVHFSILGKRITYGERKHDCRLIVRCSSAKSQLDLEPLVRHYGHSISHESEPYIPIKPYRCSRKCALALYSLYSHIQALFILLKPSLVAKGHQSNNICIIFLKILQIFFQFFPPVNKLAFKSPFVGKCGGYLGVP